MTRLIQDYFKKQNIVGDPFNYVNFPDFYSQFHGIHIDLFALFDIWEVHQADRFKGAINASQQAILINYQDTIRIYPSLQILAQTGHPFLSKADSNSCGKRTVIPAENGHGFLLKADSRPF